MSKKTTPGVYGILCMPNRKFYIGSSENVERRIAEHRAQLRGNRHAQLPRLQNDWNEFGEASFAFAQFICGPQERMRYESCLIEALQTLEHQQGYNKMLGRKWGIEASIRNTETKFAKKGNFSFLPGIVPEMPMLPSYIATFSRPSRD